MTKVKGKNKVGIISIIAICILGVGVMFSGCSSNATTSNESTAEVTTVGNLESTTSGDVVDQVLDPELTYYANIEIQD